MSLTTFTPPIGPSPGTQSAVQLALNKAEFGDGYTQASPRGLNHIRHSVELSWAGVTPDQLATLRSFFEGRGGYQSFWYQPPGFTALRKWTCDTWASTSSTPSTFSATLVESFTNES
jgi:phage-related protein